MNKKLNANSTQISGLGTAKIKKLEVEEIINIEDPRGVNPNMLVSEKRGISKNILLNWKK